MWMFLTATALATSWDAVQALEQDVSSFAEVTLTDNDQANAQLLIRDKAQELAALHQRAAAIQEHSDDPLIDAAVFCLIGEGYLWYAETLSAAPPPPGLDDESLWLYGEAIMEYVDPVAEKGMHNLQEAIQLAEPGGAWATRSQAAIDGYRPAAQPPEPLRWWQWRKRRLR